MAETQKNVTTNQEVTVIWPDGGNREYKSDVFSMLLAIPIYALDVYNGINGSDYDDPAELEIFMLDKGVSLSIRNDASFIIFQNLNLYEHQSTYNPNIPLRNLIYLVGLLKNIIKNKDLYSRRQIRIPTPHFAVFYNGTEKRPEKEVLYLSDAFEHETDHPEVELVCTVYNINSGMNKELMKKSKVLSGYMHFVDKVRSYKEKYADFKDAIIQAINECIKEHVLEDFFREHRDEVIKMADLDYTWERREELIRAEEFEEGVACGMERGMAQGELKKLISLVCKKLQKGKTPQVIAEELEEEPELVKKICAQIEKEGNLEDIDIGYFEKLYRGLNNVF